MVGPYNDFDLEEVCREPMRREVLGLNFWREVSDEGLPLVGQLKHLRVLFIGGDNVTDADIEHLRALEALENLSLSARQVTHATFEHINGLLKNLRSLSLSNVGLTDEVLQSIRELVSLREPSITGSEVAPAGVRYLRYVMPSTKAKSPFPDDWPLPW